jgi:hypothetical protein
MLAEQKTGGIRPLLVHILTGNRRCAVASVLPSPWSPSPCAAGANPESGREKL